MFCLFLYCRSSFDQLITSNLVKPLDLIQIHFFFFQAVIENLKHSKIPDLLGLAWQNGSKQHIGCLNAWPYSYINKLRLCGPLFCAQGSRYIICRSQYNLLTNLSSNFQIKLKSQFSFINFLKI